MSIRTKLKSMIISTGKRQKDCALYVGHEPEYFNEKMRHNSYSLEDLIKIADFCGTRLVYLNKHDEIVAELTMEDLQEDSQRATTKRTKK